MLFDAATSYPLRGYGRFMSGVREKWNVNGSLFLIKTTNVLTNLYNVKENIILILTTLFLESIRNE